MTSPARKSPQGSRAKPHNNICRVCFSRTPPPSSPPHLSTSTLRPPGGLLLYPYIIHASSIASVSLPTMAEQNLTAAIGALSLSGDRSRANTSNPSTPGRSVRASGGDSGRASSGSGFSPFGHQLIGVSPGQGSHSAHTTPTRGPRFHHQILNCK